MLCVSPRVLDNALLLLVHASDGSHWTDHHICCFLFPFQEKIVLHLVRLVPLTTSVRRPQRDCRGSRVRELRGSSDPRDYHKQRTCPNSTGDYAS